MENGVNVQDINALVELKNVFVSTGANMSSIDVGVNAYIHGVLGALQGQLEMLREKLKEAQLRLDKAEAALDRCEQSQRYDEESGEYRPSCSYERDDVFRARAQVADCESDCKEGERIVDECQREVESYNDPGAPGSDGHYLIKNMVENQTPEIERQLNEYINELYEYMQTSVEDDGSQGWY